MPKLSSPSMPSMPTLSTGRTSNGTTTTNTDGTTNTTTTTEEVKETAAGYALTAQTISSLSDTSDLNTLSSILGTDSSGLYNSLSGISSSTGDYNTTILLTQILEKLNQIAENQKKSGGNTSITENANENEQVEQPIAKNITSSGIVRFRLNNYDFTSSLSGVFISTPEEDGSFFVTGDRTYSLGNKQSRETFYMLFKAVSNTEGILGNYSVAISVMQDFENPNSFVYKLSNAENLTAQKTGNLASLRYDSKDLKADILISLE